jgi:AraC family transcriptional regulator
MQAQSYETRPTRVTDFIYAHLDKELDLDRLADVAAMSRWHWHPTDGGKNLSPPPFTLS